MPFRVRRRNAIAGTDEASVQDWPTGVEAFDAAWDACGQFIKDAMRQSSDWGNDNQLNSERRMKVLVERRAGKTIGVELRYDYPTGTPPTNPEGTNETNSIYWEVEQF